MRQNPFGHRLRKLREARGWTKYRLSKESRVTAQYLAELEAGEKQPSLEIARRLARALGESVGVFG